MDGPSVKDSSSGKAKAQDEFNPHTNGFRPQNDMNVVVPPRAEDLQRSYAAIVTNDVNPQGWYGSMSTYSASSASREW